MYDKIEGQYVYGDEIYVDDYYMDELWSDIEGFPNYMVSDKGRVWSIKSQQFMKIKPMDKHGHFGVCLSMNNRPYYFYIHRLVAEAFIPNPNNYPIVRHLDDFTDDNTPDNLAWGTQKDNAMDAIRNRRAYALTNEDRQKSYNLNSIPVVAINYITNKKLYFKSQKEAGRSLGIPQANIWKVVNGERSKAGGYKFEEVIYD